MVNLSFILLTWNSEEYISRCLDSFILQCLNEKILWEIIIIDNGSRDTTQKILKKYINAYADKFSVIFLGKNCGTTISRNKGLSKAKGKFCCILDSDTEFSSGNIKDVLKISENQKIGICAPRLFLSNGTVQNSVKKFPTFIDKIKKVPRILLRKSTSITDFYENFPFSEPTCVDSAISACWFFRRSLLSDVGYLDEKIFYSPEDIDFCLRVKQKGYKIIYYPFLSIKHHTQQISHRKPFSLVSIKHFLGLLYYFKKHGGWFFRPNFSSHQK